MSINSLPLRDSDSLSDSIADSDADVEECAEEGVEHLETEAVKRLIAWTKL